MTAIDQPPAPIAKKSRAVRRRITGDGQWIECHSCGDRIVFQARKGQKYKVVCNVYWRGRWQRVEQYHEPCYDSLGRPYGLPDYSSEHGHKAGFKNGTLA